MPCPKDFLRVDSVGRARAGSQRQIQTYVNEAKQELNSAIAKSLAQYNLGENDIQWVSPLAEDTYSEYQDSEFLERVGLASVAPQLREFWPKGGPCWDALARVKGGCLLVEAKSHVREIYGGGCKAKPPSKQTIETACNATKIWLGVSPSTDWMSGLYQSANRYATLYFLREIAKVPAFLVNIYFVGDPHKSTTREDWDLALGGVSRELGLIREAPYSSAVFLAAMSAQ
jgi:hypothetical protein